MEGNVCYPEPAQAGNYNQPTAPGAPYTKASFDATLSKAGFEGKTVPTLDAFLPFAKCVAMLSHPHCARIFVAFTSSTFR